MNPDESYHLLIDRALKLLSFRPRSKKEIYLRLNQLALKKGISHKTIDKVMLDLEEKNLINDKEFSKWWIDQRDTFRPKGKRLLKIELRNKGISSETIETITQQQNITSSHEFELALSLAQKKISKLPKLPPLKLKEKISNHLLSRGFSWDTISEVIDTLLKKG